MTSEDQRVRMYLGRTLQPPPEPSRRAQARFLVVLLLALVAVVAAFYGFG